MSRHRLRRVRQRLGKSIGSEALILRHVHDAVISTDLDGIIESWNPAAERLYGWSEAEAIGRHVGLLHFDDDIAFQEQGVLAVVHAKDRHEVVLRRRHKSGNAVHVSLRVALIRDGEGRAVGLLGCSHDITEQKQIAEALREANSRADETQALLTTLLRTAPVGIAMVDRDLRFVHINAALAEIDGRNVSEHLGRSVRDMVPEIAPILEPLYRNVLETGKPILGYEVCGETAAQPGKRRYWLTSYYPVEGRDGTVLGVGVVVTEITERKEAQETIRRERDFAESLIQMAQSIVLVLDTDGRIKRFNPFMERLSGYRLEEVQGKDWFDTFLPQRDVARIRRVFDKALRNDVNDGSINPIVTKDGAERQISWWATTLTDAEGQVTGVLGVGHDITDLLEAQKQTLRAERLAAIGQTITTIAHECRNELAVIGLAQAVLEESIADDPPMLQAIRLLRESRSRLQHLFEDLRTFASPAGLRLSQCDLRPIWQRAWNSLQHRRAHRDCTLSEQGADRPLLCMADALRIEQVFRNLFENALDACCDPLAIEIACAAEHPAGDAIWIAVRDNGPGLTGHQQEKLFEPFFTTKPEGTGLGLTIVQNILAAHGGTITLGRCDGPGTEFILTLPQSH